jgi:ribose 1,5-bisphosphokinase PhnN
VILSGPLGVGKTYAQQQLVVKHGFWRPTEYTTRPVDGGSRTHTQISTEEFTRRVQTGDLVMPALFGSHWYGWPKEDLERIRDGAGQIVIDVRPYTALALSALVRDLQAVWLWVEDEILQRRRSMRRERRDRDEVVRIERELMDKQEAAYEEMFSVRIKADVGVVDNILAVV